MAEYSASVILFFVYNSVIQFHSSSNLSLASGLFPIIAPTFSQDFISGVISTPLSSDHSFETFIRSSLSLLTVARRASQVSQSSWCLFHFHQSSGKYTDQYPKYILFNISRSFLYFYRQMSNHLESRTKNFHRSFSIQVIRGPCGPLYSTRFTLPGNRFPSPVHQGSMSAPDLHDKCRTSVHSWYIHYLSSMTLLWLLHP